MFERYTDRMRRMIVRSQELARERHHNDIGTEHLLLGLVDDEEAVGSQVLRAMNISLDEIRQRVDEIIGAGQGTPAGHIPFTPRARKVLELGLREALQLGDHYVGTEHHLLALIREDEGVAAQVLLASGADLNRARQQVIQVRRGYQSSGDTWPEDRPDSDRVIRTVSSGTSTANISRFTDQARRVVVLAQEEARTLSHNYIGTEHILLGLIREREGVAARALEEMGVSLGAARQQVEEIIGRGQQAPSDHIPFTPRARRVLELGLREALQLGHNHIGTEHILLGLIREGDGVAVQVLVRLGADLNRTRQQVIELLHSASDLPTHPPTPRLDGYQPLATHLGNAGLGGWGRRWTAEVGTVNRRPGNSKQSARQHGPLRADATVTFAQERAAAGIDDLVTSLDRDLIGLLPVKKRVEEIAALLLVDSARQRFGLTAPRPNLHMSFTGAPGTGKTTVALRMAEILHRLGYIERPQLVHAMRDDLVGEFIGQTAPKTKRVLERAKGGLLFIDEAYYLFRDQDSKDYGQEAIDILLQVMENDRDELVVILAGYKDRMDVFFESNPGMRSRIAHHLDFANYDVEELAAIGRLILQRSSYYLTDDGELAFRDAIARLMIEPHFANARTVRNELELARLRHAHRIASDLNRPWSRDELMRIEAADLLAGQPAVSRQR